MLLPLAPIAHMPMAMLWARLLDVSNEPWVGEVAPPLATAALCVLQADLEIAKGNDATRPHTARYELLDLWEVYVNLLQSEYTKVEIYDSLPQMRPLLEIFDLPPM
jgi:hypothetical protein